MHRVYALADSTNCGVCKVAVGESMSMRAAAGSMKNSNAHTTVAPTTPRSATLKMVALAGTSGRLASTRRTRLPQYVAQE